MQFVTDDAKNILYLLLFYCGDCILIIGYAYYRHVYTKCISDIATQSMSHICIELTY